MSQDTLIPPLPPNNMPRDPVSLMRQALEQEEVGLMSIFSLTIIVIINIIVRVAVVLSTNTWIDKSWFYMWTHVEVAVIRSFHLSTNP